MDASYADAEGETKLYKAAASSSSKHTVPNETRALKASLIQLACDSGDLTRLVNFATSGHGLLDDDLRRTAWPLLLGCHGARYPTKVPDWSSLPRHRDEDQVKLDVDRAFVHYPNDISESDLRYRREDLQALITEVLRRHPFLCYFQGFHDIAQVFLLVLGQSEASEAIARLAILRIRDFMLPTLDPAIAQLRVLPDILRRADPLLAEHLVNVDPFFALASTLTLYAHDIEQYGEIARLYDFLIAHQATVSLYLFAAMIISRRSELLEIELDDSDMLHSVLSKLPKPLDLEAKIAHAMMLFENHPPESLRSNHWRLISSYSVLKTTRDPVSLSKQSLEDGKRIFSIQERQLHRRKQLNYVRSTLWIHRKRASAFGLAVFFAVLSYSMRGYATGSAVTSYSEWIWRLLGS